MRAHRAGLLILLAAAACSEHPTAPSDSRPGVSSVSHTIDLISSVAGHACVFGAGYWKTHAESWPPRFDPAAAFFDSGQSWIEVLGTPPGGDAYYILGHQFIAAALNLDPIDPGLRPPEIGAPFAITGGWFTAGAHTDLARTELIRLATLLEHFNEGNAGVPACR